jgi:phosphoribosylformylglycinamidine cyclo-ligase
MVGDEPLSYRAAGVDIAAGERAVRLMRSRVAGASRPEVLEGIGGFAGLFALPPGRFRRPVLATSTDGVGTKLAVARAMDRHATVGVDLVAMVVDDIVVCGAEPLFVTDYLACGRVDPRRVAEIVGGVAEGCRQAGAALLGGETAEHPGLLEPDEYDLAGAGVGVVEADGILGAGRVRTGDVVLALASSGLHANGYALARAALLDRAGLALDTPLPGLGGRSLGEELLTPTRIYTPLCLRLAADAGVHAFAHITGGGLAGNLARSLPDRLGAIIDRSGWRLPAIFRLIAEAGPVSAAEMEATFNLGVGMAVVLPAAGVGSALELSRAAGVEAWPIGEVVERADPSEPAVRLIGERPCD